MGHSYKGQNTAASAMSLWPAPVLTCLGGVELGWSWQTGHPFRWVILEATNSNGPFQPKATLSGLADQYGAITYGNWYAVQGVWADGSPQTELSNIVQAIT